MTQPLLDLQAVKQRFHLTDVRMPSDEERASLGREKFSSDPVSQKAIWATKADGATIKKVGQDVTDFAASVQKSATLLFRRDNQGLTADTGIIDFDLILSEEHTLDAQICSHPVQNGDPITDHIQPQLPTGRLQVLVTNFSIKDAAGGWRQGSYTDDNRAMTAWRTFKAIFKARQMVQIVTILEVYDNVALSHVSAPRDAGTGDALIFDVSFQQIKTVQLKTVKLTAVASPKDMTNNDRRQASKKLSAGTITPDEGTMNASADTGF